jgi:hypothetical protein
VTTWISGSCCSAQFPHIVNIFHVVQVILACHNFGGACISYAMECFPKKIAKAVFITATMVKDGQRAFDAFAKRF